MSWYGAQTVTTETDEQLRERLAYVAADGERLTRRIATATGAALDEIAACFNLRRLKWPA